MGIKSGPLGKITGYPSIYDKSLLFCINRSTEGKYYDIANKQFFYGYDVWNAYELSWIRRDRRPNIAVAEIIYSCKSKYIIESKSLKLYLNSFSGSIFESCNHVMDTIKKDLSSKLEVDVKVRLVDVNKKITSYIPEGDNIDHSYQQNFHFFGINTSKTIYVRNKTLYSHLLQSNCPVTMQPDWGTVIIHYSGLKIDQTSLLSYILSLRTINEFQEQCIEKIYMKILTSCKPDYLEIFGRYTRRGGIDINPYRSSHNTTNIYKNLRTFRQ